MAKETYQFRCPFCGQHAPIERLEDEVEKPAIFRKRMGGKIAVSDELRNSLKGVHLGKGQAPGYMEYSEVPMDAGTARAFKKRLADVEKILKE
jgi:hypothetical protein